MLSNRTKQRLVTGRGSALYAVYRDDVRIGGLYGIFRDSDDRHGLYGNSGFRLNFFAAVYPKNKGIKVNSPSPIAFNTR